MELERIELSAKERGRLKLLHEVKEGHLKQIEAARRLRLTDRHVRRLLARLGVEGDRGLVHQLRGRRSNRKIAEGFTARALRRLRQARYAGFGPTLAAEHLAAEGIGVSRETVRKWMSQAGLWQTHSRKGKPVHQSFSGNHFLAVLERALCRPGGPPRGRSSAAGAGASTGRDSEHPRGTHGGFGPYRDLERGALGTASGRCPRRNARRPSGDRTAARWRSWTSSGLPRIPPKPKDASSGCSARCKTGWSRRCVSRESIRWNGPRGQYLPLRPCAKATRSASPSGLRPPGLANRQLKPHQLSKPKYIPPPDHPWRRTFLLGRNPDISTLR